MTPYPECDRCGGNGFLLDEDRAWDTCDCEAGRFVDAELKKGRDDIKAGRFSKWSDIRRTL